MAGTRLEQEMIATFRQRLRDLSDQEKENLADAGREPGQGLRLRSTFEIDPAQRRELTEAIHAQIGQAAALQFETDPALVCGIELVGNGRKLAWNVTARLESLQERVGQLLEENVPAVPGPEPAPKNTSQANP